MGVSISRIRGAGQRCDHFDTPIDWHWNTMCAQKALLAVLWRLHWIYIQTKNQSHQYWTESRYQWCVFNHTACGSNLLAVRYAHPTIERKRIWWAVWSAHSNRYSFMVRIGSAHVSECVWRAYAWWKLDVLGSAHIETYSRTWTLYWRCKRHWYQSILSFTSKRCAFRMDVSTNTSLKAIVQASKWFFPYAPFRSLQPKSDAWVCLNTIQSSNIALSFLSLFKSCLIELFSLFYSQNLQLILKIRK